MISEEDLCSLQQVSVQYLHDRSPGKICVQELYKSSLFAQIALRGLLARPLDKSKGLLARPPGQDLYKSYDSNSSYHSYNSCNSYNSNKSFNSNNSYSCSRSRSRSRRSSYSCSRSRSRSNCSSCSSCIVPWYHYSAMCSPRNGSFLVRDTSFVFCCVRGTYRLKCFNAIGKKRYCFRLLWSMDRPSTGPFFVSEHCLNGRNHYCNITCTK